MKHCACAMLLTWWYFLLQSEAANIALPAKCGGSIKINTSSSVIITFTNEERVVDECSYNVTQDDVKCQICVTVITPNYEMDCNVRVKWHTGAETFAFYSRQRYWCGMFDYSPVCMPVFSMGLTLQDLHTLALGTRYSMKFYVERSDEVGSVSMYHVSSIIRGHGLTLYRGHVIPRLHWDIFFAATFIVLFIAVFAVFAIRQYSKRKVHVANKETSDSATTDVAVELTQILQQTDLSNAPDVINNDNYTHTLPRQPPQDLADSHSYDDNDKSRLLPRD